MPSVIAQPTAEMSVPWYTILYPSARWAYKAQTASDATVGLTWGLWDKGFYNPGSTWCYGQSDAGETFPPNQFIYHRASSRGYGDELLCGMCSDFADFLGCCSNALGAVPLQSQRSRSWIELLQDGGAQFETNAYYPPSGYYVGFPFPPYVQDLFTFHEFTTSNQVIWDSIPLILTGPDDQWTLPFGVSESDYLSWVVYAFILNGSGGVQFPWVWTAPFAPSLVTAGAPPS
ncbi:MAG: hypothetical protein ACYC96_01365 [Fimbriimonadaceae bacterium]